MGKTERVFPHLRRFAPPPPRRSGGLEGEPMHRPHSSPPSYPILHRGGGGRIAPPRRHRS